MKTPAQSSISSWGTDNEQTDPSSCSCCANFLGQLHGDLCFAFQFLCWACSATATATGKE